MRNAFSPYKYSAIAGIAYFVASFFIPNLIFDFHSPERYYVMKMDEAFRYVSATLLALFAIAYFLQRFLLSTILCWIHAVISVLVLSLIILLAYGATDAYTPSYNRWPSYEQNNSRILNLIFAFILCQSILLANLAWSLLKKRKQPI